MRDKAQNMLILFKKTIILKRFNTKKEKNMLLQFLCETVEKKGFSVNLTSIFTFIGMAFSIVVSLVALVWLACFVVRLLIKTFKTQVQNSYDIFVENSEAKTQSKKERNAIKRKAKDARKMEILNMKQESRERIHRMKVDKLGIKLNEEENKAREKYGLEGSEPSQKDTKSVEKIKKQPDLEKENKKKEDDNQETKSESEAVKEETGSQE